MSGIPTQHSTPPQSNLMQQFCLRWHNHQTSLLASLPLLLDQSHLTDVTLSAEGRTVRAHRVVLSACSTFFSELFRTMDPPYHPVIVLPGTSFGAVVALLTFMYSGEVNVFEEQISSLLALAETLGIKGLADFNGNVSKSSPASNCDTPAPKEPETPSPSPTPSKLTSPLENLFAKTFQFCPSMMPGPLNFSQSAINRGAEIFARYQNQCRLNQQQLDQKTNENNAAMPSNVDENGNKKNLLNMESPSKKNKMADMRKIDKIAENLRSASNSSAKGLQMAEPKTPLAAHTPSPSMMLKSPPFGNLAHRFTATAPSEDSAHKGAVETLLNVRDHQSHPHPPSPFLSADPVTSDAPLPPAALGSGLSTTPVPPKTSNSKIYATCFICHKQLSNQYNLRVHLETHQNVRYACSVCSHVSRSKDALRKHVSYRHPGAPSPCDSESKRKRSRTSAAAAQAAQMQRHQQHQPQITRQSAPTQQLQQPISSPAESTSAPQDIHIKSEVANDLSLSSALVQNLSMPQLSVHIHNQLHGFSAMPCRPPLESATSPLKRDSPGADGDYSTTMTQSKCSNE